MGGGYIVWERGRMCGRRNEGDVFLKERKKTKIILSGGHYFL